jgi:hypothetical protein
LKYKVNRHKLFKTSDSTSSFLLMPQLFVLELRDFGDSRQAPQKCLTKRHILSFKYAVKKKKKTRPQQIEMESRLTASELLAIWKIAI